jgi:hypothetical protein
LKPSLLSFGRTNSSQRRPASGCPRLEAGGETAKIENAIAGVHVEHGVGWEENAVHISKCGNLVIPTNNNMRDIALQFRTILAEDLFETIEPIFHGTVCRCRRSADDVC